MTRLTLFLVLMLAPSISVADDKPVSKSSWTRSDLKLLAARIAAEEGVSPVLFDALVTAESNYRIDAVSPKGAMSLTQLMPATAAYLGLSKEDHFEPEANLRGGARYLREQLDEADDVAVALGAYNAGMKRVKNRAFEKWPRETRDFVSTILSRVAARTAPPRRIGSIVSMPKPGGPAAPALSASSEPESAEGEAQADGGDSAKAEAARTETMTVRAHQNEVEEISDDDLVVDFGGMTDLAKGAGV